MTKDELNNWWELHLQLTNDYHLSNHDKSELIRLNHLVMEASHEIHNKNMLHDPRTCENSVPCYDCEIV